MQKLLSDFFNKIIPQLSVPCKVQYIVKFSDVKVATECTNESALLEALQDYRDNPASTFQIGRGDVVSDSFSVNDFKIWIEKKS